MPIHRPTSIIDPVLLQKYIDDISEKQDETPLIILKTYYEKIDPHIQSSRIAYIPAKSVEYNKTDQPMLNHIRNGIWALIELVQACQEFSIPYPDNAALQEIVHLFVMHDVHKFYGKSGKEQFDLSENDIMGWVKAFGLDSIPNNLNPRDYLSVASALHKKQGFHDSVSATFLHYLPWLSIADALASTTNPNPTPSLQKSLDEIDESLDFYYHQFHESIGIFSNLVHTGVATWAKDRGLYPFLIFEHGILYLGHANASCTLTGAQDIEEIYQHVKNALHNAHPAIREPERLQQVISVQGAKGLYKFGEVNYFYAGLHNVIKAFLAAAVLKQDENKSFLKVDTSNKSFLSGTSEIDMQGPPAKEITLQKHDITSIQVNGTDILVEDIVITCSYEERKKNKFTLIPESVCIGGKSIPDSPIIINGIGLKPSQIGYRHHILQDFGVDIGWNAEIISFSRAISGIRMQIVEPLIGISALPSDNPVTETAAMFGVSPSLSEKMTLYSDENQGNDHHQVGGFWNYAYIIARDVLNREIDGVLLKDLPSGRKKIDALSSCVFAYFSTIPEEKIKEFEAKLLYPYQEKILVWLSENLEVNGSMAYEAFTNKADKFDVYCSGKGICCLTNDTPYDKKEKIHPQKSESLLKYTFSNHVAIGSTEPTLAVSVPIAIEFGLRQMGHAIKGGEGKIYFRLIPDYFYTPLLSDLFSHYLSSFSEDCQSNIREIARKVIAFGHPVYESLISDMISDKGRKGIFRYAGLGFRSIFSTFDIVFQKPREKDIEYWFFASYLGMILSATTGCRVIVGENPICTTNGSEFLEMIRLDAPHTSVKRIFGDSIPLSSLSDLIVMASLVVLFTYEINMDDNMIARTLQTLRNHLFPGSVLLKMIWRKYESDSKKGGTGAFINRATGVSGTRENRIVNKDQGLLSLALRLDRSRGDEMTVKTIHELAKKGLYVAIPKKYQPHRVEHVFRESAKAILKQSQITFSREDYIDKVEGSILKMLKRAGEDQFYRIDGLFQRDKTHDYAVDFVDYIFFSLADGSPMKLKRMLNDLSDGYYAATLSQRGDIFEELKQSPKKNQEELL